MSENEINPMLAVALLSSNVVGPDEFSADIRPSPAQFDLQPGSPCLVASTSGGKVEDDAVILRLLNPEDYVHDFPDWETRVQKDFVLAQWFSITDPVGDIGWFPRVRMVIIDDDAYAEAETWREKKNWPDEVPKWMPEAHANFVNMLADVPENKLPRVPACGNCGSYQVEIHAQRLTRVSGRAGEHKHGEQSIFRSISSDDWDDQYTAHLHCDECGSVAEIDATDWIGNFPPGQHNPETAQALEESGAS